MMLSITPTPQRLMATAGSCSRRGPGRAVAAAADATIDSDWVPTTQTSQVPLISPIEG
jgi:hypothetical protein